MLADVRILTRQNSRSFREIHTYIRTMIYDSFSAWITQLLTYMGSCFGCCSKSRPIISVDEPSKGLRIQGRVVEKQGISDGFWSTSTYDLDNSALQSQRSYSSISISNQTLSQISGPAGISSHPEFVNHGLVQWNQSRTQWIGNGSIHDHGKVQLSTSSWNGGRDRLLGISKRLAQPVPLSEIVEFLVDSWEQEGLFD